MRIAIYQIVMSDDRDNLAFLSFKNARIRKPSAPLRADYKLVYSGELPSWVRTLDQIFYILNCADKPEGFCGWPLSVSDVIEVLEPSDEIKCGNYYVDSFGFKEVDFS